MAAQMIIVLDGHDGSGKTTLSTMLARELGGRVVRPFVDSLAELFTWLYEVRDFERLDVLTRAAVEQHAARNREVPCLIFDRHWLTMFSLLPERYFDRWQPLPQTVMCWTNPETTLRRVSARGETRRNTLPYHQRYCDVFLRLARRFAVPVVDTSAAAPEESLRQLRAALGRC